MSNVIVLSGGLDSTILAYKLKHDFPTEELNAITFNYGQRHSIELDMAVKTTSKLNILHKVIDISFLGDIISPVSALSSKREVEMPNIKDVIGNPQPVTYVPYRNLILSSIALSFAESVGARAIWLGLQAHDSYQYWDTSPEFVESLNNLSNLNRLKPVQINTPFVNMNKHEEIEIGKLLGVPFGDTWTCYSGDDGEGACGTCPSCSERIQNFIKSKIKDPCKYRVSIPWEKYGIEE